MAATATARSTKTTKVARETSIRRGPAPFSTLKQENLPMTSKPQADEQPSEKTVAEIQAELQATRQQLAAAREAEKQARLAAKATRESHKDTRSKLERVIARQATEPGSWLGYLQTRVRDRVRAGQPLDEALDAVFAHLRPYLVQKVEAAQAEDEQVATSTTDSE